MPKMSSLKENIRCKLFYCDRVRENRCCAVCPTRVRCANPGINSPDKCDEVQQMEVSNETKHP